MRLIRTICTVLAVAVIAGQAHAQFLELSGIDEQYISNYLDSAATPASTYDPLVAAMVAKHHEHGSLPYFLSQELPKSEHERLRLSLIIEYCSESNIHIFCNGSPMDSLIAMDSDNFIPYLIVASSLLQRGEDSLALATIETGLNASTINDYYLDKLDLVRSELSTRGYPADKLNLASEGYSGAVYSYGFYDYLLGICRVKGAVDDLWKNACFNMGARLEDAGKSWGATVFGASIQRDVLQNTDPESPLLPGILARREHYNLIRIQAAEVFDWWLDDTLVQKPDWFYRDAIEFGELEALERALERAQN